MKSKNHVIYGTEALLRRLKSEYEYIGRVCELRDDRLVVFALPPRKVKKKELKRGKPERNYGSPRN